MNHCLCGLTRFLNGARLSGKRSFNNRCLHHIGDSPNPYEQAISIIGRTLSSFDEDNLIPCFGFGDGSNSFFWRIDVWF